MGRHHAVKAKLLSDCLRKPGHRLGKHFGPGSHSATSRLNAYDIKATWQLYDTETNSVIQERDRREPDRPPPGQPGNLALVASFTYKQVRETTSQRPPPGSIGLSPIRQTPPSTARRPIRKPLTAAGGRSVGASDGEVNRCSDLSTVGTLTVEAKAWFSDERTTGLLGSDSITLRIVDTKPVKRPPSRPSGPVPPATVIPKPARH